MRISDWSSDVCSSDLSRGSSGRCRCRTRSRKRFSQSMPANRRPRQRPERRTFIGVDTAMVRPLGFLVGLGFIVALLGAIVPTPLSNEPQADHAFHTEARPLPLLMARLFTPWDTAMLQPRL